MPRRFFTGSRAAAYPNEPRRISSLSFSQVKQRLCRADELGRAMINAALLGYEKQTLENPDIRILA